MGREPKTIAEPDQHKWTLDMHIKTFYGYTPWLCERCGAIVDTVDHQIRLRPCLEIRKEVAAQELTDIIN